MPIAPPPPTHVPQIPDFSGRMPASYQVGTSFEVAGAALAVAAIVVAVVWLRRGRGRRAGVVALVLLGLGCLSFVAGAVLVDQPRPTYRSRPAGLPHPAVPVPRRLSEHILA